MLAERYARLVAAEHADEDGRKSDAKDKELDEAHTRASELLIAYS
jgi:hypothetical protein